MHTLGQKISSSECIDPFLHKGQDEIVGLDVKHPKLLRAVINRLEHNVKSDVFLLLEIPDMKVEDRLVDDQLRVGL